MKKALLLIGPSSIRTENSYIMTNRINPILAIEACTSSHKASWKGFMSEI